MPFDKNKAAQYIRQMQPTRVEDIRTRLGIIENSSARCADNALPQVPFDQPCLGTLSCRRRTVADEFARDTISLVPTRFWDVTWWQGERPLGKQPGRRKQTRFASEAEACATMIERRDGLRAGHHLGPQLGRLDDLDLSAE